jgi:general secretion pathway protein G
MEANMEIEKEVARRTPYERGLTLLEIMIVLAIIGLIMGVLVGPKVMRSFEESRVKTAFLMLKEFEGAYTRWVADNEGDCPEKLEDLLKYTNKKDLKDPWGSSFVMKCGDSAPTDTQFGVISLGKDKKEGSEDDIHSWDAKPKT